MSSATLVIPLLSSVCYVTIFEVVVVQQKFSKIPKGIFYILS